jgi:hypothetical protein
MKSCVSRVTHTQTQYIPGQYDDNINIQVIYTAATQDFMRIITAI